MIFNPKNIAILGASGAIGSAFTTLLSQKHSNARMFAFSRNSATYKIDYSSEDSIAAAAEIAAKENEIF